MGAHGDVGQVRPTKAEIAAIGAAIRLDPKAAAQFVEWATSSRDGDTLELSLTPRARAAVDSVIRSAHLRDRRERLASPARTMPRQRGAGRPAARRSATPPRGSPDDDGEPASPPRLTLVKRPALYLYGCTTCVHCGAVMGHYEGRLWCPTPGCQWAVG